MKSASVSFAALFFITCLFMAVPSKGWSQDDRLDRMEKDVTDLRKENEGLKKRLSEVESDQEEVKNDIGIISKYLNVSGYADGEYSLTDSKTENNRFRIHHLSLFFSEDITKEWKLFSEVEFEDAPRIEANTSADTIKKAQGIVFVEQMYIEYNPSFNWDVRLGRLLTPFGIWSIYHYPPYVPFQTHPLFFKNIFPETSDGIQLRNSFSIKDVAIDTHLYASNGAGNPGGTDRNDSKAVGARINLEVTPGVSFGGSYFRDKDNLSIIRDNYGSHLLLSYGALKLQGEYLVRENKTQDGTKFRDNGLYAILTYDIGKWTLAGRYDNCRCSDISETGPATGQFRYTGAVNYHFAHNVVGKVEYDRTISPDKSMDNNKVIFAVAVAVGDL